MKTRAQSRSEIRSRCCANMSPTNKDEILISHAAGPPTWCILTLATRLRNWRFKDLSLVYTVVLCLPRIGTRLSGAMIEFYGGGHLYQSIKTRKHTRTRESNKRKWNPDAIFHFVRDQ